MVLSEARGLWLFLVIREGIGCKWVTRCRGTQGRTVLTDTPLEPEHLQNPTHHYRRESQNGKPASPEMLKLLVDAIVWGRSSLLSSRSLN